MPCLNPKQIKNPRYKEGGWRKRMIYCREFGFDNCVMVRTKSGGVTMLPPDYYITVPCGKCAECLRSKRLQWSIRLLNELRQYKENVFITLTLDPASLQRFESTPKKPLMLYLDRLRKRLGYRPRYFFVSELGDGGRLHYHGILFNTSKESFSFELQRKKWTYGVVWIGYCNDRTANYIVKYLLKGNKEFPDYKPFLLCSNGIGKNYVTPKKQDWHINGFDVRFYIPFGNIKYPLPKYYKDKLFDEDINRCIFLNRLYDNSPFKRLFRGVEFTSPKEYYKALSNVYKWSLKNGYSLPDKFNLK